MSYMQSLNSHKLQTDGLGIKSKAQLFVVYKKHPSLENTYKLRVKWQKSINEANGSPKQAAVAIVISDKIYKRPKLEDVAKPFFFLSIKVIIYQDSLTIICAPNIGMFFLKQFNLTPSPYQRRREVTIQINLCEHTHTNSQPDICKSNLRAH